MRHGILEVIDQIGQIKDMNVWITEYQSLLNSFLDIARADTLDMAETVDQLESFVTIKIAMWNIIFNSNT